MFTKRLAVAATVLVLVAGACGGTEQPSSTTTVAATTSTTAAPTTTPAAPSTSAVPAPFPVTLTVANGDITIPAAPEAIVSLSATHTEMLFAIGAGDRVIAADSFSNYPAEAPTTEMSGFSPNVEAIVEMGADLVVIDGDWDGIAVGALTDLGVPVLVLPGAAGFDDVYAQIEQLGVATGNSEAAGSLVDDMRAEIAEILGSLPTQVGPLTFYHELDNTFYSVTTETFIGQVYSAMGLVNIADAAGGGSSGYPQLSEEYILEQDPNLIFLADTICCGVSGDSLRERPGWATLSAVQNGGVVELSDDMASRWGPRIVDYMRAVAEAISAVAASA